MRYPDVEPVVTSITDAEGPFPLIDAAIDGESRIVLGGLLDSQPGFMQPADIEMAEKYLRQREGAMHVSA